MSKVYTARAGTLPPGWTEIGTTEDFAIEYVQKYPVMQQIPSPLVPHGQMFLMTNALDGSGDWDGYFWSVRDAGGWIADDLWDRALIRSRQDVARKLGAAMRKAEARQSARKALRSTGRYCRLRALLTLWL